MPADGHNSPSSVAADALGVPREPVGTPTPRLRSRTSGQAAAYLLRRNNGENGWRIKMEFRGKSDLPRLLPRVSSLPFTYDSISRFCLFASDSTTTSDTLKRYGRIFVKAQRSVARFLIKALRSDTDWCKRQLLLEWILVDEYFTSFNRNCKLLDDKKNRRDFRNPISEYQQVRKVKWNRYSELDARKIIIVIDRIDGGYD